MTPFRPSPLHWLLVLIVFLSAFPLDVLLPSLPALASFHQVPLASVAAEVALFPLLVALAQLLVGPLADRYGHRRLFCALALLSGVGSVMAGMASSFIEYRAWRVLQALGCAGFGLLHALVQEGVAADARRRVRILMTTLGGVFIAVAPALGVVLHALGDWPASFWVYAGLSLLAVAGALKILPSCVAAPLAAAPRQPADRARYILGCLGVAVAFSAHFVFIVGSPLVLLEGLGFSALSYAVAMLGYGAGYVLGGVLALRLARRLSVTEQLWAGYALMLAGGGVGVVAVGGAMPAPGLLAGALSSVLGVCLARPAATCLAMDAWPDGAGTAACWLNTTMFVVGGATSYGLTLLGAAITPALPWLVVALALSGFAVCKALR